MNFIYSLGPIRICEVLSVLSIRDSIEGYAEHGFGGNLAIYYACFPCSLMTSWSHVHGAELLQPRIRAWATRAERRVLMMPSSSGAARQRDFASSAFSHAGWEFEIEDGRGREPAPSFLSLRKNFPR